MAIQMTTYEILQKKISDNNLHPLFGLYSFLTKYSEEMNEYKLISKSDIYIKILNLISVKSIIEECYLSKESCANFRNFQLNIKFIEKKFSYLSIVINHSIYLELIDFFNLNSNCNVVELTKEEKELNLIKFLFDNLFNDYSLDKLNQLLDIIENSIKFLNILLNEKDILYNDSMYENIFKLSNIINLSLKDTLIFYNWVLIHASSNISLSYMQERFYSNNQIFNFLSKILSCSVKDLNRLFIGKSILYDKGIIEYISHSSADGSILENFPFLNKNIRTCLFMDHLSTDDMFKYFFEKCNNNVIYNINSFDYVDEKDKIITAFKNNSTIKILLWGNAGTGKTSLANAILKYCNYEAIKAFIPDNFDNQRNYSVDRINSVTSAIKLSSLVNNPAIIVDEAESILNDSFHKDYFTLILEDKNIPQIWIVNNLNDIHPSYIRRFDFVLHIDSMPILNRHSLVNDLFANKVDDNFIHRLSQLLKTPAEINAIYEWCTSSQDYSWKNVLSKLSGYKLALNQLKSNDSFQNYTIYPAEIDKNNGLNNIIGYNSVKQESLKIIDIFTNPKKYQNIGSTIPKGCILSGPSGTGKTLFVKSLAKEVGVNLIISDSASLSTNLSNIDELFKQVRKNTPCILFFDEIDVLCCNPKSSSGDIDIKKQQLLNKMLIEIDGFSSLTGVLIIGATNRLDSLDSSICRSGRLSNIIKFNLPSFDDRTQIWSQLLTNIKTEKINNNNIINLSKLSSGLTAIDIKESINNAAIESSLLNKKTVSYDILKNNLNDISFGKKSNITITEDNKKRTAIHEAGHAFLANYFGKKIRFITIEPRDNFLGCVSIYQEDYKESHSFKDIKKECMILMAGVLAEKQFYKTYSEGGTSDLQKVSQLLIDALTIKGYGNQKLFTNKSKSSSSEYINKIIDIERLKITKKLEKKTSFILNKYSDKIKNIADNLYELSEISEEEDIKLLLNI